MSHAMNLRDSSGQVYNAGRDLRQCWPAALNLVSKRFEANAWPQLTEICEAGQVGWDQLCDAMEALCDFLAKPTTDPHVTMEEALRESGWFELPVLAQMAVLAMLGTVATGQLYYAIRETTPLGAPAEDMMVLAERVRILLARPDRSLQPEPDHGDGGLQKVGTGHRDAAGGSPAEQPAAAD